MMRLDATTTIGGVQEVLGLSPRAIRFYEECGLISTRRDHLNRRIFDGETRRRLGIISRLRRAGLGLEEISSLLNHEPTRFNEGAREHLRLRRRALAEQLAELDSVEAWLESTDLSEETLP